MSMRKDPFAIGDEEARYRQALRSGLLPKAEAALLEMSEIINSIADDLDQIAREDEAIADRIRTAHRVNPLRRAAMDARRNGRDRPDPFKADGPGFDPYAARPDGKRRCF
jgi:hypothetical protein